jgi:myosin heavy subunit
MSALLLSLTQERNINLGFFDSLERVDSQLLDSNIENLIELHSLTESSILHVLRSRFNQEKIYTFVSNILIAVNPFQPLPLYGTDLIELYYQQIQSDNTNHSTLPPHIFALSQRAYQSLFTSNTSQSIIISGESGAGKTESIKHILRYIAAVSRRHEVQEASSIQDKIVEANPLMEAFGNSKTSRNNNRSRHCLTPATQPLVAHALGS